MQTHRTCCAHMRRVLSSHIDELQPRCITAHYGILHDPCLPYLPAPFPACTILAIKFLDPKTAHVTSCVFHVLFCVLLSPLGNPHPPAPLSGPATPWPLQRPAAHGLPRDEPPRPSQRCQVLSASFQCPEGRRGWGEGRSGGRKEGTRTSVLA